MNKKVFIALLVACFYICCSPSVYKPTAADVESGKKQYTDLTLEQLNSGFHLYSDKCGSCHTLYKPQDISEERWTKVLPDMKIEAHLTDKEYDLISRYVKSKRNSYNAVN
jgi:hypothetical protein